MTFEALIPATNAKLKERGEPELTDDELVLLMASAALQMRGVRASADLAAATKRQQAAAAKLMEQQQAAQARVSEVQAKIAALSE